MDPSYLLWTWLGAYVSHIALGVMAFKREQLGQAPWGVVSQGLSFAAVTLPVCIVQFMLCVFLVGGSSEAGAMLIGGDANLIGLYLAFPRTLAIGTLVGLIAAIASLVLPPYPPRYTAAFASRACAAFAAGLALYWWDYLMPGAWGG